MQNNAAPCCPRGAAPVAAAGAAARRGLGRCVQAAALRPLDSTFFVPASPTKAGGQGMAFPVGSGG